MSHATYPPGPRTLVPFRGIREFVRDPIGTLLMLARTYGDLSHVKTGRRHFVLLAHPDHIQDVLVTHNHNFTKPDAHHLRVLGTGLLGSEGEFHLRQRRALQPLFLRERITSHAPAIVAIAERQATPWQDGADVKLFHEMLDLTQCVVGKTLFDSDVAADSARVSRLLTEADSSGALLTFLPFSHFLEKLPLPGIRRFTHARDELYAFVQGMIDEHRRSGKDRGDFLSHMLKLSEVPGQQDLFTDELLRYQTLTFFGAGYETTASALAWTWYLLARNPDAEAKLHAEVDSVLQGRMPTAEDVPHLPYTEMVFAEAMRVFPPVYVTSRRSIAAHSIGGYDLPANTVFLVSPYVTQHDSRWFADPDKFEPERMSREKRAKLPRFAYFPFGGGPRQCIGEAFAWLEGVLIVATLARHWRFRWMSEEPVGIQPQMTCQPRDGLPMRLERRRLPGASA